MVQYNDLGSLPKHSMYAIYAYIDPLKPPQLIGKHGPPMECLGYYV